MRRITAFILRWIIPATIGFTYLLLPDFVRNESANISAPNWIARVFYTVILCNSFIGAAKIFDNPDTLKMGMNKYLISDRDTLIILMTIGDLVFVVGTTLVMFHGLA